jgi:hypothetical protein
MAGSCVCATGFAACGTACCAGNGCCGGGCQTVHDNGLRQHYYDCGSLGVWSLATAQEAANAWNSAAGTTDYQPYFAGYCFARQTASACATWCYDGTFIGKVNLNVISTSCLSPNSGSPSWN